MSSWMEWCDCLLC